MRKRILSHKVVETVKRHRYQETHNSEEQGEGLTKLEITPRNVISSSLNKLESCSKTAFKTNVKFCKYLIEAEFSLSFLAATIS
jgi:hypothetical protein